MSFHRSVRGVCRINMNRTLIIHIGWHKTATSLIQLYFARYREKLREYGVCYPVIDEQPNSRRIRHSYLVLSIRHRLQLNDLSRNVKVCDFDELVESSAKDMIASGCRFAVLSDEGLSLAEPGIAKLMGRYRDYFEDIKIIAYLRRQDYFLESFYAQLVKVQPYRISLSFEDFIHDPQIIQRADYALILNWWAQEFGRENILVAPFEPDTISPDPLTCFFKLSGLPATILEQFPLEQKEVHVSPPREITEYFRHLNLSKVDFFAEVLAGYLEKSSAVTTNTRYFCQSDRERILRKYENSNKEVARKYLQREDGVLFEEPVADCANCPDTWPGLKPLDLLEYALPVTGKMSIDVTMLRHRLSELEKRNAELKKKNLELQVENQRIGSLKKTMYRFLREAYRKMV